MRHVSLHGAIYPIKTAYQECVARQAISDAGIDFLPVLGDSMAAGRFLYRFDYKAPRELLDRPKRKLVMLDEPTRGMLKQIETRYRLSGSASVRYAIRSLFDNMSKSG